MFAIGKISAAIFAACALGTACLAQSPAPETKTPETKTPETRLGEEGYESPPATLEQIDWLVGQWVGEGIQGAPAMESWLPPTGPVMVGTFVQQNEDATIMFTEHLYLMEEEGTLVLRLKHFNADLTGWEEKDDMLTFRLVAMEECAAYFNALTLRCADSERPGEGLVAAVRMQSGGELVFRFDRQGTPPPKLAIDHDCDDLSMRGIERCFIEKGKTYEKRHAEYLAAAKERHKDDAEMLAVIDKGEEAFTQYSNAECSAIYASFGMGSIRNLEAILCSNKLLQRRTHTVWQHWLTFADSTQPLLPEPIILR